MAADIVPVRLGLTKGDLYTLWAPLWRDAADEWQGFLGEGDDLYAFESTADLVAYVRTSTENDRRGRQIRLTATGFDLVDRLIGLHLANEARILDTLTPAERGALTELLLRICASAAAANPTEGSP